MKVTFGYFAQIRQKAGVETEAVDVPDGATAVEALKAVEHGEEFRELLFEENGVLRSTILFMVNGAPVAPDHALHEGDQVQVFSPVAGG
ncbi:MAG: MoaD/ThiS family protein [Planctomycetota bacterium]